MKKTLTMLASALMAAVLCVSASAAFSAKYECEDGVITGAAKEYKGGNIQDVSIASGGKIVGLGGVNDAPQMASFVTWSVEVPVDGEYDITFAYDTDNSDEKGASMLVDGERYDVDIDISLLPDLAYILRCSVDAILSGGKGCGCRKAQPDHSLCKRKQR